MSLVEHVYENGLGCSNDVMNDVVCVKKRDVYPQKNNLVSKNDRGISFSVLNISVVYQNENISYCMDIPLVERQNNCLIHNFHMISRITKLYKPLYQEHNSFFFLTKPARNGHEMALFYLNFKFIH